MASRKESARATQLNRQGGILSMLAQKRRVASNAPGRALFSLPSGVLLTHRVERDVVRVGRQWMSPIAE
jgi:hypothetical protein